MYSLCYVITGPNINGVLSTVPAGAEGGELGEYRGKLVNFLEISNCYQPERLISDFPFDGELASNPHSPLCILKKYIRSIFLSSKF